MNMRKRINPTQIENLQNIVVQYDNIINQFDRRSLQIKTDQGHWGFTKLSCLLHLTSVEPGHSIFVVDEKINLNPQS